MLEQERQTYEQRKVELEERHAGRVVLIKGGDIVGFFDTEDDALSEGARRFGLTSFLVRRIGADEHEFSAPALTLGILSADPTWPSPGAEA